MPMSESPSRKNSTAEPASINQIPSTSQEQSSHITRRKVEQCNRFLTFARYIRDRGLYAKTSAGGNPSVDDDEDLTALRQQWQDLLNGKLLEGARDVLKDSFLDEAKIELRKLEEGEANLHSRQAWKQVLDLVQECKAMEQDVEGIFADGESA